MADVLTFPVLRGRRVLVVEDDYFLAEDLRRDLEAAGAEVLGPAPSLQAAFQLLAVHDVPDLALLDVNLGDEMVFPLAEALIRWEVPFAFVTAYGRGELPPRYAHVPLFGKPLDPRDLARAFGVRHAV